MARPKAKRSPIVLISVAAHLGLAGAIAVIPPQKFREVVAIALAETQKQPPPKPPTRNEPPKPVRPARSFNAAPRAAPVAALPQGQQAGLQSFKDIGISLDSGATDGLLIPMATAEKKPAIVAASSTKRPKTLLAKRLEDSCSEELVKPIPDLVVRPEYTNDARDARIEGRVRVSMMIDELGAVTSARVIAGLGYGLDEAALEAVRKMRFRPGTRCSKPIATPFVMAVRFLLGT